MPRARTASRADHESHQDHDDTGREPQAGERLQRVLANRGIASRRAAEEMITAGRVVVNGTVVTVLGTRVDPVKDAIVVDGRPLRRQRPRFLMLNKPSGFITTVKDERSRWTVMDLIKVPERVYPVGRLDRETQGLLLFTNDGDVANRVMHPRYGLSKEYHVLTEKRPSDRQLQMLREGVAINGRTVTPDEVRLLRETREGIVIRVVLHEGLYHVVRRMMESVGIEVARLRRVRLGPLMIQAIPLGHWRDLTPGELVQLYEALGLDRTTADRINEQRTLQLEPVGTFNRPERAEEAPAAPPTQTAPGPRSAAPERRPAGDRRDRTDERRARDRFERRPTGRPPGGPRQARRQQRDGPKDQSQPRQQEQEQQQERKQRPGGRFDGSRPSPGNRDRRSRGGR